MNDDYLAAEEILAATDRAHARRVTPLRLVRGILAAGFAELGALGVIVLCHAGGARALGGALVAFAAAGLCLVVVYATGQPPR